MNLADLYPLLDKLIEGWENEIVEFKRGNKGFSTSDIGKYFSALSNEANLRNANSGWLVFGVDNKTRRVVGSDFRLQDDALDGLKHAVSQNTNNGATFRDIHVLPHEDGRVILMEIPPAPKGIPISWSGHFYARAGESLVALDQGKQDNIRNQTLNEDWSAGIIKKATVEHLDPEALKAARQAFATRHSARLGPVL